MIFRNITFVAFLGITFLFSSCVNSKLTNRKVETEQMMVRLAEIEIEPAFLDEYLAILKEESEASVRLEPGVISIYPMFIKESPTAIRILEIYANREAYQSHLKTPHFLKYKNTTVKMVKSLRLIDMNAIDPQTMPQIFQKIKE